MTGREQAIFSPFARSLSGGFRRGNRIGHAARMAYLRYGTYTHDQNEASLTISKDSLENDAAQQYAVRHTWQISGTIHGTDAADVAARLAALEAAYSVWFRDLVLLDDSGNTLHALPNRGSLSGVKIIRPPSYPNGGGGQFSTFRDYAIVATADYPSVGATNPLKMFRETLAFSGGGPVRAVVELADGLPQEQILKLRTACRALQSGEAVGMYDYPFVPPPLFPGREEQVDIPPGAPQFGGPFLRNGVYTDFSVRWNYRFISAVPLFGRPNRWPAG